VIVIADAGPLIALAKTDSAIAVIEALKSRPDVWLSATLCDSVIANLRRMPPALP